MELVLAVQVLLQEPQFVEVVAEHERLYHCVFSHELLGSDGLAGGGGGGEAQVGGEDPACAEVEQHEELYQQISFYS